MRLHLHSLDLYETIKRIANLVSVMRRMSSISARLLLNTDHFNIQKLAGVCNARLLKSYHVVNVMS